MPPTTANDGTPVDPTAATLTKAIRQVETGGDYNASGKSGEHGAYQWLPGNFEASAKQYGLDPSDFSPVNQDKVAYHHVSDLLKQGYTQSQVASIWNSGSPNWEGKVGVNKEGVQYDVPAYVDKVKQAYLSQSSGQTQNYQPPVLGGVTAPQPGNSPYAPPQAPQSPTEPLTPTSQESGGFINDASGHVSDAIGGVGGAVSRTASGEINPISGFIQGGGAIARGITGVANDALTHLPVVGGIAKGAEDLVGQGAQALANTGLGQQAVGAMQDFSAKYPELSADVGGALDIASVFPVFKGAGLIKDAAGLGLKGALTGGTDAVYEAVAPSLSGKGLAKAISEQGTSQKGLLKKTVLNESPAVQKIANTVKTEVPGFNPKAPITEQINQVQKVIDHKVEELKQKVVASGQDRIYSPNELRGVLSKIETPISLKGTPFEKQIKPLKEAVIKMAAEKGYKVSDLLDVQKEFDSLVSRTWPNLYSSESAPMRQAVRGIRDALSTFTEDRLPQGFGFKEARLQQHYLIKAVENMAGKAASGSTKEIGTTAPGRFLQNHPGVRGLLKTAVQAGTTGLGIKGAESLIP